MAGEEWYFNTVTGEPELGKISPISRRMGPYRSREEALKAWDIVRERNRKWDRQDAVWRGDVPQPGSGVGEDTGEGSAPYAA